VEVELKLPPDCTFLSQVMYEGVLYLIHSTSLDGIFNLSRVSLPEGSLCNAFASMNEEAIEKISIRFVGNDIRWRFIEKLLESIKLEQIPEEQIPEENTYKGLLKLLKERCKDAFLREECSISLQRKGEDVVLDGDKLAVPQLFKIDRYTGISSGEMPFISRQVGLRASPEVILIGLLGIYSSYITTVWQQNSVYHYFVFLSPNEIVSILASRDRMLLENIYSVKNYLRHLLSETLRSSALSEVIVLEVMLSSKIRAKLSKANLDKVDFMIFKISPEGGQTYKIYETVPLTVYASPFFYEKLAGSIKEPERLCEIIWKAISQKDGAIVEALDPKNKFDEADKVLNGVLSLYRFVTLADFQYLTQFLRCMREACDVLGDKKEAAWRLRKYEEIQKELSYLLKIKRGYLRGEGA